MHLVMVSLLAATLVGCALPQGQSNAMPAQTLMQQGQETSAKAEQYIYVLDCCAGYGGITVYNRKLQGIARNIAARNPSYMTLRRNGTLYVVDGWSQIAVYERGNPRPARKLSGYNWLVGVATDSQSKLYAIDCESCTVYGAAPDAASPQTKGDRIDVYDPGGKRLLRAISRDVRAPHAVAFDSHGNLYVANGSREHQNLRASISVFEPGAKSAFRKITTGGLERPSCIAIDKANNVFVNSGSNSVWEYAAGSSKVIRTITNGVSSVDALALDSKGTLYVANASQSPSHGWISIYPPGVTRETYRITDGVNLPVALLLDHDDNLFVSNDGGMFGHVGFYPANARSPRESVRNHSGFPGAIALGSE